MLTAIQGGVVFCLEFHHAPVSYVVLQIAQFFVFFCYVSNDWALFDRIRGQDIKLLKELKVGYIFDLMVEKKKVKYGMKQVSVFVVIIFSYFFPISKHYFNFSFLLYTSLLFTPILFPLLSHCCFPFFHLLTIISIDLSHFYSHPLLSSSRSFFLFPFDLIVFVFPIYFLFFGFLACFSHFLSSHDVISLKISLFHRCKREILGIKYCFKTFYLMMTIIPRDLEFIAMVQPIIINSVNQI